MRKERVPTIKEKKYNIQEELFSSIDLLLTFCQTYIYISLQLKFLLCITIVSNYISKISKMQIKLTMKLSLYSNYKQQIENMKPISTSNFFVPINSFLDLIQYDETALQYFF